MLSVQQSPQIKNDKRKKIKPYLGKTMCKLKRTKGKEKMLKTSRAWKHTLF